MSDRPEQVNRLVQRFYDDMWNHFDVSVLDEITDPEVRFQGSLGDVTVGRDGLADYVHKVQTAFPDFHNEVRALAVDGETAFARLRYTGTHLGPLDGAPATGRRVDYAGVAQFTVSGGVIAEVWVLGDRVTLYEQIGYDQIGFGPGE